MSTRPVTHPRFPLADIVPTAAKAVLLIGLFLCASFVAYGQTFTVLHRFSGVADGGNPSAPPMVDAEGNVYVTTPYGGPDSGPCFDQPGCGVVLKLAPNGTWAPLYSFLGGVDGQNPYGAVIHDSAGNLYGTTIGGLNGGTIFKLDQSGVLSTLYDFSGGTDGFYPQATMVRDPKGDLYGTTMYGGDGTQNCFQYPNGCGVIFQLKASGEEIVLYQFTASEAPGYKLRRGIAGKLYGTSGYTVFRVDEKENLTVLYSFTGGTDGGAPNTWLIEDKEGTLYGTAMSGGQYGAGVVFKLDIDGNETVLYNFTGGADGMAPFGGLVRDISGNLYGTSGDNQPCQTNFICGEVFELNTTGELTVLYTFSGQDDGALLNGGLTVGREGNGKRYSLYGTTQIGGDYECVYNEGVGCGTVFKITLPEGAEFDPQ